MKTKFITLALAAGLAGFAANAKADTRTRINVSFGINPSPVYTTPAPVYVPAPVVGNYNYSTPNTVVVAPTNYGANYGYNYTPARGHWENVTTKVWVPERWVVSRNHWGRPVRVLEPGYFTYRTDRVWVDHNHFDHDHNRAYDYRGYDYRG
jgi:hypothetical protein